jgi:hypothetical protein
MFRNPPDDPIERIEPDEPIERIEPDEPIERSDPAEPIDPALPTLKALPAEATDATDQMHRIEARLCFDQTDGDENSQDNGSSMPSRGVARGAVREPAPRWRRRIVWVTGSSVEARNL